MSGEVEKALIVAPKFVKGSWYRDIEKLPPHRRKLAEEHITITHYDIVWRREEFEGYFDAIVLDEAHNICNRTAKRTKWAIGYKTGKKYVEGANRRSKYRYILTGTPIDKGKLEQFYCLMDFLIPDFFGDYKLFAGRYLIERQLPSSFVTFVVGYRHKDELLERISPYIFRVLKKDCLDLPEKLPPEIIKCELKEKKLYKEAEQSYILDLMMNFDNPLVKVAKLRQICSGFLYDDFSNLHELKCGKLSILDELIESILPSKIVIFAQFTHSIEVISDLLTKKKIKHLILNGQTKDKDVWKKFQDDESIKIFIGQYQSAKEGIDLFSATHMIFFEPCMDTRTLTQATDRIHRIGVKSACSYYHLITEGTIEEVMYKRLERGEDFNVSYLRTVALKGGF
jgi:SNF2 family DNA or RNA helicase